MNMSGAIARTEPAEGRKCGQPVIRDNIVAGLALGRPPRSLRKCSKQPTFIPDDAPFDVADDTAEIGRGAGALALDGKKCARPRFEVCWPTSR